MRRTQTAVAGQHPDGIRVSRIQVSPPQRSGLLEIQLAVVAIYSSPDWIRAAPSTSILRETNSGLRRLPKRLDLR